MKKDIFKTFDEKKIQIIQAINEYEYLENNKMISQN